MGNKSITKNKQQQPRREKNWSQNLRILPSLNQIKVNYNVRYLSKKKIKSSERLTLYMKLHQNLNTFLHVLIPSSWWTLSKKKRIRKTKWIHVYGRSWATTSLCFAYFSIHQTLPSFNKHYFNIFRFFK